MRTLEYHTLVAHHITVASLTAARTSKTAKQTDRQPMRSCRRNLLSAILLGTHLATCDGFAAAKGGAGFGGGGGGRKRTAKKKEKKKKATATAAKPTVVASPPPEAAAAAGAAAAAAAAAPEIQEISLGPGRPPVLIRVPPNALSPDLLGGGGLADRSALLDAFGSFRGRGDVIWPASLHLARLVANCPSFVGGRAVLDLGCGLGLASLAALLGHPRRLALSDIDDEVLALAMESCADMVGGGGLVLEGGGSGDGSGSGSGGSVLGVERLALDWSDRSTWPPTGGEFDTVLASDVLYDEDSAGQVADLIAHLLLPRPEGGEGKEGAQEEEEEEEDIVKRALLVDPTNRENRDAFVSGAARNGLLAEVAPFPGQAEEFVLINVTPAA